MGAAFDIKDMVSQAAESSARGGTKNFNIGRNPNLPDSGVTLPTIILIAITGAAVILVMRRRK